MYFSAQNVPPTIQNSLSSYFARQAKQFADKLFQRISDQVSIITSDAEADLAIELRNILTTAIDNYRAPAETSQKGKVAAKTNNLYQKRSSSGHSNAAAGSESTNANLCPLGQKKAPKNTSSSLFTSKRGFNSFHIFKFIV
jgi:hypothetical protein